jgi:HEAT repeat protein
VEALTGIGGQSSADWMLVALGDPEPGVRRTAVEALGDIGGDTAEFLLRQALFDADAGVREAAEQMLAEQPIK